MAPHMLFRIAALASAMAIVAAGGVFAQQERCEGTVTDDGGNPLAGVEITFLHLGTNQYAQPVKTSKKGKYAHNVLEASTSPGYEIRATLEGHKMVRISAYSSKQDGTSVTYDTQRGGPDTYMVGAKQEGLHKVAVPAQARAVTGSRGKCVVDFIMAPDERFVEVFNKLRAEQLAKEGKTAEPAAEGAPAGEAAAVAPAAPAGPSALETARSRVSSGEFEGAVEPARKAVAEQPDSAEAHKLLGTSLAKTKNLAEAEPALKKAIELDSALVGANFEIGMLYIEKGRLMQAIPHFEKELELTPDSIALLQNLGKLYADTEQYDRAIAAYEKLVALNPDAVEFYGLLADAYKRSGNTAKELETYKRMGDRDTSGMAFYNLGNIMFNKSEMAQAAEAYRKALEQSPNNAQAHYQLGMTYVNLAKFKEAAAELETFIKLKPKDPKAAEAKSMVADLRKMGG